MNLPSPSRRKAIERRLALPSDQELVWVRVPRQRREIPPPPNDNAIHRAMVEEAFRWGEAYYQWLDSGKMAMALPLCENQRLTGGIVVRFPETFEDTAEMRQTATRLLSLLEEENLVNEALLRERASSTARERLHAEAIHSIKQEPLVEVRNAYWRIEPELFLAMRRGERQEARRLLNRLLLSIFSYGSDDLTRIKAFLLDLVTMMSRTMVEYGADPAATLDQNFTLLGELRDIHGDEAMSQWTARTLELLIDRVSEAPRNDRNSHVQMILDYIRSNCGAPLTRDSVARKMGLSPSHFSRTLAAATGKTFTQHLQRSRIDKAAHLVRQGRLSLLEIALECGFQDHSHFTKVFRKIMGQSPKKFRNKAPIDQY